VRFQTKFDTWLVVVLAISFVSCVALPVTRLLTGQLAGPVFWTASPLALWAIVLSATLPQYYEVRETGLFLRQGWRKALLDYRSLVAVESFFDARSAGVFSTSRIAVKTLEGKSFVIAVAEDERFFEEIAKRCPQLDRRASGLGMPFAPLQTI
jgi:hypothetical protein